MHNQSYTGNAGFTLVEMLVVILVLGVMIGIGIQNFSPVLERAGNTVHNMNVTVLRNAGRTALLLEGTPSEVITWDSIESSAGDDYKAADYLEDWPNIPSYAQVVGESYEVTLGIDGKVSVTPGKVD